MTDGRKNQLNLNDQDIKKNVGKEDTPDPAKDTVNNLNGCRVTLGYRTCTVLKTTFRMGYKRLFSSSKLKLCFYFYPFLRITKPF